MKRLVNKLWRNPVALISAVVCAAFGQTALADAYYDQGVKLYGQRNFRGATPYFDAAMRSSPSDSNAVYYAALTYQQLNDWPRAKQMYRQIMQKFPGSQAAGLAQSVLQKYDPDFVRKMGAQGSSGSTGSSSVEVFQQSPSRSADFDQLPNEGKIYFQRVGNSQHIDASVNGRPCTMVFDTGAEGCVFGKNNLRQMGINPPSGPPQGMSEGVGSSGGVATWQMSVDLKVGNITRRNFPVAVLEEMPMQPLLGQTFFKDFQFTTDPGANSITFKKKGQGGSSGSSQNDVPFRKEGNELVVNVEINGRPYPMYFDTGADQIAFSAGDMKNLGMSIPEDAEMGVSTGIGGATRSFHFTVNRMRLGPVEKSNVDVSVVEASKMGRPLLGQNFYKDWQFTIDYDRHVIHFLRR